LKLPPPPCALLLVPLTSYTDEHNEWWRMTTNMFWGLLQALAMNLAVLGERVYKPFGSRRTHFLGLSLLLHFSLLEMLGYEKIGKYIKHMLKICDMCKSMWVVKVADTAVSAVSKVVILGPSTPQAWDQNEQNDQTQCRNMPNIVVTCCCPIWPDQVF
jgi:hypothetical protein